MNTIDLHIHSKESLDGEFTPIEIVDQCHAAGLKVMAVTDHNSCNAVAPAIEHASSLGITCIPAIEIDCMFAGINIHLLGYGVDHRSSIFSELFKEVVAAERKISYERIERIRDLGYDISVADFPFFEEKGVIAPEDIAMLLLDDGRFDSHELLKPYRPGGTRGDNPYANFFWDLFDIGKPCYVDMGWMDYSRAYEMIISHGGVPVVAHPGVTLKASESVMDDLIAAGVKGIECFSSYHTEADYRFWYEYAESKSLIITAGSDYHGYFKPSVQLGGYGCHIDDDTLMKGISSLL